MSELLACLLGPAIVLAVGWLASKYGADEPYDQVAMRRQHKERIGEDVDDLLHGRLPPDHRMDRRRARGNRGGKYR